MYNACVMDNSHLGLSLATSYSLLQWNSRLNNTNIFCRLVTLKQCSGWPRWPKVRLKFFNTKMPIKHLLKWAGIQSDILRGTGSSFYLVHLHNACPPYKVCWKFSSFTMHVLHTKYAKSFPASQCMPSIQSMLNVFQLHSACPPYKVW